jgi:predicted enzyme related to lactoylglutathione lyase
MNGAFERMRLATVRAMAEFNGDEPGTPCWVDLGSTDPAMSWAFYTDLFGWEVREAGPELGGRVLDPPRTIATVGRFAVLSGPHGEAFAVIRNE